MIGVFVSTLRRHSIYFVAYATQKEVYMKIIKKQGFFIIIGLILLCAVLAACSGSPAPVLRPDELDAAIRETSNYLNKQLPRGNKLAILNIQSEFPALSEYIIDELIANTVNDRVFSVVDRQQLNTIRAELDFQMSGEVDDKTAQALGRMTGAQIIISGAVSRIGDLYRMRIRALSVQNAEIAGQFNRNIPDGPTVAALVRSKATGYGGTAGTSRIVPLVSGRAVSLAEVEAASASPPVPAKSAPESQPVKVYKVGDTGPAGGIIFYDKGNNSGGWRYLEAAPANTERELVSYGDSRPPAYAGAWNSRLYDDTQSDQRLGSGKLTTRKMMEVIAKQGGGINTAGWYCDGLVVNDFDDWYLPTIDELLLMYANLASNNLGSFQSRKYWSSNSRNTRYGIDFSSGNTFSEDGSGSKHYVRACRQF